MTRDKRKSKCIRNVSKGRKITSVINKVHN